MTDKPVSLDKCRSRDNRIAVEFRRHEARTCVADNLAMPPVRDEDLHSELLVRPADCWADVARKAIFLLDRYAATSAAQDIRVQILIKRALYDIARLTRRKERKP
ncbi:MAG: hypothetical protein ACXIU7_08845 [Roseinatronobacter sp.]